MIVVDASVAARWSTADDTTPAARSVLRMAEPLKAPDLIVSEVTNVLWKLARAGLLKDDQVPRALQELSEAVDIVPGVTLAPRAFAIARKLDHPAYDGLYLALSEALQAPLVTLDARLFRRTRGTPWEGLTTLLDAAAAPT